MTASLEAFAGEKLRELEARSLRRRLKPTHRLDALWVERDGRRLLSFSCNDYLNLSHHPQVKAAAKAAVDAYGAGAGASRLVSGDHPLFAELEAKLAAFGGHEAACVFGSGYLANAGVIPTFMRTGDLVLLDALAHASIWTGARLSGAKVVAFAHNDLGDLRAKLDAERPAKGHVLVATDGVFSMDGDTAPLAELSAICAEAGAWLLVDDAHGLGVLADGGGTRRAQGRPHVDLNVGTLSKALGSYGAYVCGAQSVVDLIRTRARPLIYSTGLPPASAAAAIAALEIVEGEPALTRAPLAKARRFTAALGLPQAETPIVPVVLGDPDTALAAAAELEAEGFLVVAIRPPTVPEGASRLRLAFTAGHPDAAIDQLAELVRPWLERADSQRT
jgi:8-amino-7-oxononanoate synthase